MHIGRSITGQHLTKSPYDYSFYSAIPHVNVDYHNEFNLILFLLKDQTQM